MTFFCRKFGLTRTPWKRYKINLLFNIDRDMALILILTAISSVLYHTLLSLLADNNAPWFSNHYHSISPSVIRLAMSGLCF